MEEEEGGEDEERAFGSRWHLPMFAVEWGSGADTTAFSIQIKYKDVRLVPV